jgi:hypothetical protein
MYIFMILGMIICVKMCTCIYVCKYTYVHINIKHIFLSTGLRCVDLAFDEMQRMAFQCETQVFIYNILICIIIYISIRVHIYLHIYIPIYLMRCEDCIYIYIYIHSYTYIHTYLYIGTF